jgi:hypothetical protein
LRLLTLFFLLSFFFFHTHTHTDTRPHTTPLPLSEASPGVCARFFFVFLSPFCSASLSVSVIILFFCFAECWVKAAFVLLLFPRVFLVIFDTSIDGVDNSGERGTRGNRKIVKRG